MVAAKSIPSVSRVASNEIYLTGIQQLPLDGVGYRVVHGAEKFRQAHLINNQTIDELRRLIPYAPLHNPTNTEGILAARRSFPDLTHVAVFDTTFYAIDQVVPTKLKIRHYDFYGPSHKYVAKMAAEHLKSDLADLGIISCHPGNGASVCVIEFGQSIETSLGMTPVEGPSGIRLHTRDLETRADGDDRAHLAITVFCHRVKKYIGAYAVVMGENRDSTRRRILQHLQFLALHLDEDLNAKVQLNSTTPVIPLQRIELAYPRVRDRDK